MESRESYTSPDGKLMLFVHQQDGDFTLGFEGWSWHTHGDVLAGEYALRGESGLGPEAAIRRCVADILEDRAVLALMHREGRVQDAWVTDSPADELNRAAADETIEMRFWSGRPWLIRWPFEAMVRDVLTQLAAARYAELELLTGGVRLSASELANAIREYGRRVVPPPDAALSLDVVPITGSDPASWSVNVPIWTAEEGVSDLTLELTVRAGPSGAYDVEIDDLHVL